MLRSFATTLKTLSGAEAVTLVMPPLDAVSPTPLLIHDGSSSPVPEMASLGAALRLLRGEAPFAPLNGHAICQFESSDRQGRLIRIAHPQEPRQESDSMDTRLATTLWIGLRWPSGTTPVELSGVEADQARWWHGVLELGGTLARGERERSRLDAQLEAMRRDLEGTQLIYRSAQMETVLESARRAASSPLPLLIHGPSGAGKKLLAHTLHELSPWRDSRPLLVHCGAMDRTSSLVRQLIGELPVGLQESGTMPHDGWIILDAVDELPADEQEGLLDFLKNLEKMGEKARKRALRSARVISVTHRDLARDVQRGRFRADLFERLTVSQLDVPALAARQDDILLLANHFLTRFSLVHGKRGRYLATSAEQALLRHPWPGNVRELESRVLEALLVSDQPVIGARELRLSTQESKPDESSSQADPKVSEDTDRAKPSFGEALDEQIQRAVAADPRLPLPLGRWLAHDLILEAHAASGGVSRRAAARLGIPETTFRRRYRQAATEIEAGLARRSPGWETIRAHLGALVHESQDSRSDLLHECRQRLLRSVSRAVPGDTAFGAVLMGITEPTFRRWLAAAER